MHDADVIFEWKVHPIRDHPQRAVIFILVLSLIVFAVWWSFQSAGWALIAAVLIGGSLHRFWLVTHYRISENELEYRRLFLRLTRRLSDFRRVVLERQGAFLSPFAAPHRLDPYRGLYVPYPPDAGLLKAFLERRCAGAVSDE